MEFVMNLFIYILLACISYAYYVVLLADCEIS